MKKYVKQNIHNDALAQIIDFLYLNLTWDMSTLLKFHHVSSNK